MEQFLSLVRVFINSSPSLKLSFSIPGTEYACEHGADDRTPLRKQESEAQKYG
jgi:hypothetical protein